MPKSFLLKRHAQVDPCYNARDAQFTSVKVPVPDQKQFAFNLGGDSFAYCGDVGFAPSAAFRPITSILPIRDAVRDLNNNAVFKPSSYNEIQQFLSPFLDLKCPSSHYAFPRSREECGQMRQPRSMTGESLDWGVHHRSSLGAERHPLESEQRTTPYLGSEKQPLKCNQCQKIFKTKYTLAIHLRMPSHTGARPFVCSICGKGFRLSSTLCRHKIIHTSAKPHKCNVCEKAFNRSSTLKTHLRIHSDVKEFSCHECGKGFHQKGNLRNHVLIHTGEKPHRCSLCDRAFNKLSNLKFHMHVHTDNSPYRCRFCKVSFSRRCDLKIHVENAAHQE